jgi:membrane-associated phospholipid phosphatase
MHFEKALLAGMSAVLIAVAAPCQTASFAPVPPSVDISPPATPGFQLNALRMDSDGASMATHDKGQPHGFVGRMLRRTLEDQKELYAAPFKPSNIKWDVLVLAGTGALLATDKRIERHLPDGHFQLYQNSSNIALGGLAASLAGLWIYGLKTDHPHARETGNLELETLTDTFLIYAPMQFIAGRQRPGEGNGNGDFLRHHALNTSFPGGHAMFTWSMAAVLAREYPKPWVRALAYGTALTVTAGRLLARDHWSSDMFVGSALGFAIGTHIFHAHCDPELSQSCHRHMGKEEQP